MAQWIKGTNQNRKAQHVSRLIAVSYGKHVSLYLMFEFFGQYYEPFRTGQGVLGGKAFSLSQAASDQRAVKGK